MCIIFQIKPIQSYT